MRAVSLRLAAPALIVAWSAFAGADDAVTAEALFQAGREASRRSDHATACAKFRESYRLDPALGTLLNIAICEEGLGQLATAWQHYEEVLQGLRAGDPRLSLTRDRAAAVRQRLPYLTLRLGPRAPTGTRVYRGGTELTHASFDVPLPLDPGKYEFVVRAEGYRSRSYSVAPEQAQRKELTVEPGPALTPARAPAKLEHGPSEKFEPVRRPRSEAVEPSSKQRTFGFVIGGAGVAALAVGAVTGLMVLDRKRTVEDQCQNNLCSDEGLAAGESGTTLSAVSTIAFTVGIAGVGGGALVILTSPTPPTQRKAGDHDAGHRTLFSIVGVF